MCGIAGVIHKNSGKDGANIGKQMTTMLQLLKHRGPDSTGFGLYGNGMNHLVARIKIAEQEDFKKKLEIYERIKWRVSEIDKRLKVLNTSVINKEAVTEYSYRFELNCKNNIDYIKKLVDYIEDIEGVEFLSIGNALELIKDLGDAVEVSTKYGLNNFSGTHAIGHTRMATESDVDIRSAHPYWAYPFSDVSVVHNGQLTNYWTKRRDLERKGNRFSSNCDSELIAVYIADKLANGIDLETAMRDSIEYLDGVFTYLVATSNALGMAKDVMAAKPMVLYESDDIIAMASEEVAIRGLFYHRIDTYDPYHGEVKIWQH